MTSKVVLRINAANFRWKLLYLFVIYVYENECAVPIDIVTEIITGEYTGQVKLENLGKLPYPFTADPLMKLRKHAREKRDLQQQLNEMDTNLENTKSNSKQHESEQAVQNESRKQQQNYAVLTTLQPRIFHQPTSRSILEQSDMRRQTKKRVTWNPLDKFDRNNPLNIHDFHYDHDLKEWYKYELRDAHFVNDDYQPFLGPWDNPHPYPSVQHGHLIFLTQILPILKSMLLIRGIDAPPDKFRVHKDDQWAFGDKEDKIFKKK